MHDEVSAREELGWASENLQLHLAHIVRNNLQKLLYVGRSPQVQKAVLEFEKEWREGTGL